MEILKNTFDNFKKKGNIFFLVDIVLNHCAINSEWIKKDFNSGFNLKNTPELTIAFKLDQELVEMSKNIHEILGKSEIHD